MTKGNAKGGSFEREICKELSYWWTDGARDDVYRRSATSGGRATVRARQGKRTAGQYGDISIADPIGQPLLDLCSIELKTGYATHSVMDLIDKVPAHKPTYEKFFAQAAMGAKQAQVPYWLLIARRHGHAKMIYMPFGLYTKIRDAQRSWPELAAINWIKVHSYGGCIIYGTQLLQFFKLIAPSTIKYIVKAL